MVVLDERELIHRGCIAGNMELSGEIITAMSGAVGDIGVFIGTDQKRLDGYRLAAHEIFIGLGEARRIFGRPRMQAV